MIEPLVWKDKYAIDIWKTCDKLNQVIAELNRVSALVEPTRPVDVKKDEATSIMVTEPGTTAKQCRACKSWVYPEDFRELEGECRWCMGEPKDPTTHGWQTAFAHMKAGGKVRREAWGRLYIRLENGKFYDVADIPFTLNSVDLDATDWVLLGVEGKEVISAGLDQAKRLYEPDSAYIWIDDKGFHIEPVEDGTE